MLRVGIPKNPYVILALIPLVDSNLTSDKSATHLIKFYLKKIKLISNLTITIPLGLLFNKIHLIKLKLKTTCKQEKPFYMDKRKQTLDTLIT